MLEENIPKKPIIDYLSLSKFSTSNITKIENYKTHISAIFSITLPIIALQFNVSSIEHLQTLVILSFSANFKLSN